MDASESVRNSVSAASVTVADDVVVVSQLVSIVVVVQEDRQARVDDSLFQPFTVLSSSSFSAFFD